MNFEKEVRLADVMSDNISKDPVELGVPERLCLEEKVRTWIGQELPFFDTAFSHEDIWCSDSQTMKLPSFRNMQNFPID